MAKKRPNLASAKNPPKRASKLRDPMQFVTIFADSDDEKCISPCRYVTKFMDIPIIHILCDSSVPIDGAIMEDTYCLSEHVTFK